MQDLQELGEAVASLPPDRLDKLKIDERLRDAIDELRRTKSFEGKRRQVQYIGKLMKFEDPEPLREAVASYRVGSATDTLALHQAEYWRDQLLADDDALANWVKDYPATDVQQLRSLVRAARKEKLEPGERHGRAYRDLFKLVKEQMRTCPPRTTTRPDPTRRTMTERLAGAGRACASGSSRSATARPPASTRTRACRRCATGSARAVRNPVAYEERLIADDAPTISATLRALVDEARCDLVLTTGGTGPAPRDVTPEATLAVADREMPGFGEQMRQIGLRFVPTAILSRQVGVIRGRALILNLPGQPKAIAETLEGLRDQAPPVPGIFAAVPYCIDLIGGPYIETDPAACKAFRPKSAQRAPSGAA